MSPKPAAALTSWAELLELTSGREDPTVRLRGIARPHLQRIQRITGETTNLIVIEGRNVIYIDQVAGLTHDADVHRGG